MNKIKRIRLDRLLVEKGVLATRERARAFIMAGSVLVEENIVDKAVIDASFISLRLVIPAVLIPQWASFH